MPSCLPLRSARFRPGPFLAATALGLAACSQQSSAPSTSAPETTALKSTPAPRATASPVPPPVLSGNIPVVIPAHDTSLSPTDSRPFFDVFSWQSFIALNWPALAGQPGVANQPNNPRIFQTAPNGTPVVWTSYKTTDDLFGTGNQRPLPWSAGPSPVSVAGAKPGVTVFSRLTKASTPEQLKDTQEAFSFPLVDQNRAYARYEVRYNQPFYDFVRGIDAVPSSWLYLLKNLAPREPVTMPWAMPPSTVGALMVKAAWREMTPADIQGNRYYIIQAMVADPVSGAHTQKAMGLVGLHIAQKLQAFPEWIWSSFEQVDNVQRGVGSTPTTPISFNNGTNNPATVGGWANRPASKVPVANPSPVQVTRFNPIPNTPAGTSTQNLNAAYQQALKGTVWQFYELVITQWPSDPANFKTIENGGIYPANAGGAFPASGCTNTTMETYFQSASDAAGSGGNSCMSCHYRAGQADFSWGLLRRAH